MSVGFQSPNTFDRDLRDLIQFYDVTAHLHQEEHERLEEELQTSHPSHTVETSVGTIQHNLNRLYEFTALQYPRTLRSLVLIGLVTRLERYLAELIWEISARDLSPFRRQEPLQLMKAQLLSLSSLESLKEWVIRKEVRSLTSGGINDLRKYYNSRFSIDLADLGVPYSQMCEVHERRHLHVHNGGRCDEGYAQRHPTSGLSPGQRVPVPHEYLRESVDLFRSFGRKLGDVAANSFPTDTRKKVVIDGALDLPRAPAERLIVRFEVSGDGYDASADIPRIAVPLEGGSDLRELNEFLYTLVIREGSGYLLIGASNDEIRAIMWALKSERGLRVHTVAQLTPPLPESAEEE